MTETQMWIVIKVQYLVGQPEQWICHGDDILEPTLRKRNIRLRSASIKIKRVLAQDKICKS